MIDAIRDGLIQFRSRWGRLGGLCLIAVGGIVGGTGFPLGAVGFSVDSDMRAARKKRRRILSNVDSARWRSIGKNERDCVFVR